MAGNRLREVIKERGAAMAMLLVVIAIAAILAFTLAGGSIFHLTVATKEANGSDARNLAESAIAQCISNVMADTTGNYGKSNETIVVIRNQDPTGTAGVITSFLADVPAALVTFDKNAAKSNSLPYSYNNLTGTTASDQGWYGKVPAFSMQIIAAGKSCGNTKYLEAILKIPPFPYCIATSGKFVSSGDLYVASVGSGSSGDDIKNAVDKVTKALPGHVLSNNSADDSVLLNGKGKITGDVQTAGEVKMGPSSTVVIEGEVRNKYDPIDLPAIDLNKYDPATKTGVKNLATLLDNPTLQGFNRVDGTLNVTGELKLDGALLYVTGSLNVGGGVSGKGAIVIQGNTTIGNGVSLSSDNLVALLCKGNISITGTGTNSSSSFQGLVYSAGNFAAKDISICGYFINAGGENSLISLSNVTAVKVEDNSEMSFTANIGGNSTGRKVYLYDTSLDEKLNTYNHYYNKKTEIAEFLGGNDKLDAIASFLKESGPAFDYKPNGNKYDFYIDEEKQDGGPYTISEIINNISIYYQNSLDGYFLAKGNEVFSKYISLAANIRGTTLRWTDYFNDHPDLFPLTTKPDSDEGPGVDTCVFSFNLNEFLRAADRMKVVLWREIDSPQK